MTDPYIQINGTKIEVFDNDLSAVRTLKQLSDGTYITNIATGAEVITGTNNTKIVTPKAIGDADGWSACTAPTFSVATYDNGSGGQPTTVECRIRRSKNLCFVHYTGSGVKNATGSSIIFNPSVFPAAANTVTNTSIGTGSCYVTSWLGLSCIWQDTTNVILSPAANIADNTTIIVLSFTLCYEI